MINFHTISRKFGLIEDTISDVQCGVQCSWLNITCLVKYALCSVQCAVYILQCSVGSVQYALRSDDCIVCSVYFLVVSV